jgi:hypothetical protein
MSIVAQDLPADKVEKAPLSRGLSDSLGESIKCQALNLAARKVVGTFESFQGTEGVALVERIGHNNPWYLCPIISASQRL